jgi:hypothetical protein
MILDQNTVLHQLVKFSPSYYSIIFLHWHSPPTC